MSRIAVLLSLLSLAILLSCDLLGGSGGDGFDDFPEGPDSFSLEVRVEDEEGNPVEDAEVGVRPCYETGCTETILSEQKSLASDGSLTSFEAEIENGDEVVLSWKTTGFSDAAVFYVDRKADGPFSEIGFVEAPVGSSPTTYRFEDSDTDIEPGNEYSYRLVKEDFDGTETPLDTITVELLDPESTEIAPIYPNPISTTLGTIEFRVADPSTKIESTAYLLNGEEVTTIVDAQVSNVGRYTHRWPRQQVSGGLYLIHSRAQVDGNTVASSTDYAIRAVGTSNATVIGSTSEGGVVSTDDPTHFPALYDLPEIELRDESGGSRGTITDVPQTVQFAVSVLRDEYVFEREVAGGENTLTLTVSP